MSTSKTEGKGASLADAVALLEGERDYYREQAARLEADQATIARRMYRRGYLAGRSAKRRGAPTVTNPECSGRGETRMLTGGGPS